MLQDQTQDPQSGGNIEHFKKILDQKDKSPDAEEFTFIEWTGTAQEMILLNLLEEYEKEGKKPAVINDKLVKMGVSFKPHKKC